MSYDHSDDVVMRFASTLPKWRAVELLDLLAAPDALDALPGDPHERFKALLVLLGKTTSRPNYERAQEARRRLKLGKP